MGVCRLSRGENISEFYDHITSLRLGAQAVLERNMRTPNHFVWLPMIAPWKRLFAVCPNIKLTLNFCIMFRGISRKLIFIWEIKAKHNLHHHAMDKILRTPCQTQPNTFEFKRIQALSTLRISMLLTQNTIPSHTFHCLRLIIKLIAIQISETR